MSSSKNLKTTIIELGNSLDDNMHMVFVNRNSTNRIVELCQDLDMHCPKATDIYK